MEDAILEIVDTLEMLLDDLPLKPKTLLSEIIAEIKAMEDFDTSEFMKIQDDLEVVSNMPCLDSFSRNEIINVLSLIETLI
ncbi:MAG: hypothetical protein KC589_07440 [Nanoarchaeota archaeon]|nr:hypothetical protein [Nanoarchaeota archaeon]